MLDVTTSPTQPLRRSLSNAAIAPLPLTPPPRNRCRARQSLSLGRLNAGEVNDPPRLASATDAPGRRGPVSRDSTARTAVIASALTLEETLPSRPFKTCLVLLCLSTLAACGTGDGNSLGTTESIELNAIIQSVGPLPVLSVEYSVNCFGDDDSTAPDEVRLDGELEPPNSRAAKIGVLETQRETWAGFVDLPHGSCSMQLRGRDTDDEVICTAAVPFSIAADTDTLVIATLECSAPGFPSVREFNICPDLLALRCDELDPVTEDTSCVVSFLDQDNTCSPGCDPQSCVPSDTAGLTCTSGPDPGVSTTITCADAVLDCTGDGIPDPFCTINSNTPDTRLEVDGTLVADFFVACVPPAPTGMPGSTITCTAVTSDGDLDCDRTKLISVICPEPNP